MENNKFFVSNSSPHFKFTVDTQKIMISVLIALLPQVLAGIQFFGLDAVRTVLVSVAGCVGFEALFQWCTKQKIVVGNFSSAVTGVMLALVLPPTAPIWMILIGDFVAIVIAKGLFGGLGSNIFNPALTGRAFLFLSFPAAMGSKFYDPYFDSVTGATSTLKDIKDGIFYADTSTYLQYFIGNRGGCIGETSILMILISLIFLIIFKVIDWRTPVTMIATVVGLTFITTLGEGFSQACNNALIEILAGGLVFGATFMATDYATTPVTSLGRVIFGFGAGLITLLIRKFGSYPEGVMFAILIMNAFSPLLNNLTARKYGYGKKATKLPVSKTIVQDFDISNAKSEVVE